MSYEEIILSVTAIVATCTFLWSVVRQKKRDKEVDLRAWQSVAVQSFFEKRGPNGADLNDVLQWYRAEATAYVPGVSKSELSEFACRRVLIGLVGRGVIEQIENSRYRLSIAGDSVDTVADELSDMMKPVLKSVLPFMGEMTPLVGEMTPLVGDRKIQKAIYSVVAANPFTKTFDAVVVETSKNTGEPVESVTTVLAVEVGSRRLQTNEQNMLGFGPTATTGS